MDSQSIVYSDKIAKGIKLKVNGILVIGTKIDRKKEEDKKERNVKAS